MYIPKHFKEEDQQEIEKLIHENSFAILITVDGNNPLATHIPIMMEEDANGNKVLRGHVAKANNQWKTFESGQEALVIFTADHAYISASWYKTESVPTWNFMAVHVYGKIRQVNETELRSSLERLMNHFEKNSKHPMHINDFSANYIDKLIKQVVGFEIKMERAEAKSKLSQNKDDTDYKNVVNELNKIDDANAKAVAEEMAKRRKI